MERINNLNLHYFSIRQESKSICLMGTSVRPKIVITAKPKSTTSLKLSSTSSSSSSEIYMNNNGEEDNEEHDQL